MEDLIEANLFLMNQAGRLLERMEDGVYGEPIEHLFEATVGQHVRHCLDHYASFVRGLLGGVIDYDQRERVASLECSTDCALEELERLKQELKGVGDVGGVVRVKMDCGGADQSWQESSLGRELQFLVSHTVHHFAMIGGACREKGVELEKGFGLAPSTIRHRKLANID